MKDFRVAAQLYLGRRELDSFSAGEISTRILRAGALAGIDSLIIWAGCDPGPYEPLVRACREGGLAPYLWLPVLADPQGLAVHRDELLEHYDGALGYGSTGVWEKLGQAEERFLFCCPNRASAVDRLLAASEALLDRLDLDGVMLDRIRYPSPVNGLETLFGCYCASCQQRYREIFARPLQEQRQAVTAFLSRLRLLRGATVQPWESFAALWDWAGLADLASFKVRSVTAVVERFAAAARKRALKVGLDLYSPSLAPAVSQDYGLLSRCCDWLKPMVYCNAVGPAGLPLELACLQRGLKALCPGLEAGEIRSLLRAMIPWEWPQEEESLLAQGLPGQTIGIELDRIRREELAPEVRILAGVEAMRYKEFRVEIDPEMLRRRLDYLPGRAGGLVASWNLLYIPEENLRAIAVFAGRS